MNKRGQSEIIVTFLIIIIILAALSVISVFIINQVRNSSERAELKSKIFAMDISVESAKAGDNYILLKKNSDSSGIPLSDAGVIVNGVKISSSVSNISNWNVFEVKRVNLANYVLKIGDKIEFYLVPSNASKIDPILISSFQISQISSTPSSVNCSSNSDCGSSSSSLRCSSNGKNISATATSYICNNPGTLDSSCSVSSSTSQTPCDYACVSGSCLDGLLYGLEGYYPLNGTVKDYSGNNRDGFNQDVTFVAGKIGEAGFFNGLNSSVDMGTWFDYQSFTISFWVKPQPNQTWWADIMDNDHGYHDNNRNWVMQTGNNPANNSFGWGILDGSPPLKIIDLTPNIWTNIIITRNSTSKNNSIYVNGLILSSVIGISDAYYQDPHLRLGNLYNGGNRAFNGTIDEFRVYNRTLPYSEIQRLYALS